MRRFRVSCGLTKQANRRPDAAGAAPACGTSVLSDGLGRGPRTCQRCAPKGIRQTIALRSCQRKCGDGPCQHEVIVRQSDLSTYRDGLRQDGVKLRQSA